MAGASEDRVRTNRDFGARDPFGNGLRFGDVTA